jgi:hypothetical protein
MCCGLPFDAAVLGFWLASGIDNVRGGLSVRYGGSEVEAKMVDVLVLVPVFNTLDWLFSPYFFPCLLCLSSQIVI